MKLDRGFLILAVNDQQTNYVKCAEHLAESLHDWMPDSHVTLLTDKNVPVRHFDQVKILPYGNLGGFNNDWQVFAASPYTQTIKLEADMICVSNISHWWTNLQERDLAISLHCRNHFDQIITASKYRKVFIENNLPDVYNAITYWRYSQTANDFFRIVRQIFQNWNEYRSLLKYCSEETPSTDLVYSIACLILGEETCTLPQADWFTMVHMKQHILGIRQQDWRDGLVCELSAAPRQLRFDTVQQWGLVHYYHKDWL